jgi:hypothetical protein
MTDRILHHLTTAGLAFPLTSEPLHSTSGPVPGRAIRRADKGLVMGRPVSDSYVPLTHVDAFAELDAGVARLEDEHGPAKISAAGQHEGATARVLVAFPESPTRERSMGTTLYPAALFTHGIGGVAGLTGRAGSHVSVCMNGMFTGESMSMATRHTANVRKRLVRLPALMEEAISQTTVLAKELDELSRVEYNPAFAFEAFSYINRGKVLAVNFEEMTAKEREILLSYQFGPGNVIGTAAALIQAVTHYTSHKASSSKRLEFDTANAKTLLDRARKLAHLTAECGSTSEAVRHLRLETAAS